MKVTQNLHYLLFYCFFSTICVLVLYTAEDKTFSLHRKTTKGGEGGGGKEDETEHTLRSVLTECSGKFQCAKSLMEKLGLQTGFEDTGRSGVLYVFWEAVQA